MMQALDKDLRGALEKTVKAARTVAETAANAAVDQLGVGHDKPEAFLSDTEKALRNRLRTHGKQLGDARDSKSTNPTYGKQEVQHLVQEVAYQHWHRMLFARFLADNNLLMYDGVAVTIEECDELASDEGAKTGWELAGKLAARMLPQVFKPGSSVFELTFAPEHQSELERLLKDLPDAVFKASDSLGWVYQFWQADNKERINKSEVKIGADELPAVTQLFTEPYMVSFLLHNSLGAWWATRHPGKPCPVNLDYFRTLEDGTPAAGKFEGWPDSLANFKLLDPCCGSGHFLVAAFLMLVPMRMAAEGLSAKEAVNRVLAENIHGLELDPRCVEIAVFAVALEAWRYPDASGRPLGVREIPAPNIACCGLKVAAKAQDWEALAPDSAANAAYVRQELRQLHASFSNAPVLGSLLDPGRSLKDDLATSSFKNLKTLIARALASESNSNQFDEAWDLAISAQGLLEAAEILENKYQLVITNVPYLARGKQSDFLCSFSERHYEIAKNDLATVFLLRCLELTNSSGLAAIVLPENWAFLSTYRELREHLLDSQNLSLMTFLGGGAKAFDVGPGNITSIAMCMIANDPPRKNDPISVIDISTLDTPGDRARGLPTCEISRPTWRAIRQGPGVKITARPTDASLELLSKFARSHQGLKSGDDGRYRGLFWERPHGMKGWIFLQGTLPVTMPFGGLESVMRWENDGAGLARRQGLAAWGGVGVAISQMGTLPASLYSGSAFDSNVAPITVINPDHAPAVWAYCSSQEYHDAVRNIDKKVAVANATLVQVPFDLSYWQKVAENRFPDGLPKPYSDDPTQWIFHGYPQKSDTALQVAVARLVGYVWPAELDDKLKLCGESHALINRSKALLAHADKDGIVCIPPVGREPSASDRLLNLLAAAYGDAWSSDTLAKLLSAADHAGKSLESWLRDKFFTQHCALFGSRPFVWHVWDGLRDGFAALVNYHKLDYKTLESLIYTYLGDWIGRQKRDADNGVDGAQEKLAAAEVLKKRLELILAGEAPYDIFVRWKPIEEQPIGWNPDLNDGVRLNIRPFLSVPDVGKRGTGVLRDKPKSLHWEKDRGSDVPSAPWYELGLQYGGKVGDRINDHHLTLEEKRTARAKLGKA